MRGMITISMDFFDEAFVTTEHVTITLDAEHLERAHREAQRLGVSLESYLSHLVHGSLAKPAPADHDKPHISAIFGIGASAERMSAATRISCWVRPCGWSTFARRGKPNDLHRQLGLVRSR